VNGHSGVTKYIKNAYHER